MRPNGEDSVVEVVEVEGHVLALDPDLPIDVLQDVLAVPPSPIPVMPTGTRILPENATTHAGVQATITWYPATRKVTFELPARPEQTVPLAGFARAYARARRDQAHELFHAVIRMERTLRVAAQAGLAHADLKGPFWDTRTGTATLGIYLAARDVWATIVATTRHHHGQVAVAIGEAVPVTMSLRQAAKSLQAGARVEARP
ncbi:hypothetical protein GZ998_03495 [Actinomyces sp. 594]|uniref:hypothetical protein n=1 Tax=Actinomyces sp. 594 TaxID=2057793 RepID=UPI001C59E9F4|nr:hypothetical protein [Actinomyces sp. 594]MBW3068578.1 hypothetical protein [Actinomyces sp. 594]